MEEDRADLLTFAMRLHRAPAQTSPSAPEPERQERSGNPNVSLDSLRMKAPYVPCFAFFFVRGRRASLHTQENTHTQRHLESFEDSWPSAKRCRSTTYRVCEDS